jgi:F0F1-type ATP synthase membrane subunit b/b'
MNRNTQHLYLYDYIYLFGKVFLFILLGLVYYLWVGKKEVTDAYDTTQTVIQETVNKANAKINELKEMKPVTSK